MIAPSGEQAGLFQLMTGAESELAKSRAELRVVEQQIAEGDEDPRVE